MFLFPNFLEDSYIRNRSGIKITPGPRKSGSKNFVAQSLPMAVPIYNQRNDDDYDEDVSFSLSFRLFFSSNRKCNNFDPLRGFFAVCGQREQC